MSLDFTSRHPLGVARRKNSEQLSRSHLNNLNNLNNHNNLNNRARLQGLPSKGRPNILTSLERSNIF
jgi:hypothetical protein